MTNKKLKQMIDEEIELLKPDRSVLDKAKSIMIDTQYISLEINGNTASIKKKKFTLIHLACVLMICTIVVTLSVCLPFILANDSRGQGGISGGELINLPIASIAQEPYAIANNLLHFDYETAGIMSTVCTKYSNLTLYISISETIYSDNENKILTIYVDGNELRGDYKYDILEDTYLYDDIVVTFEKYDVNVASGLDQTVSFNYLLRGKFAYNQANYYFEVYTNHQINVTDLMDELFMVKD